MHLQGLRPARPLTHDLLGEVITALGHAVQQVRVVDFREGTFYGELVFENGTTVSARPSDAVALAVRIEIPVFVDPAVLDSAGVVVPEDEEARTCPRRRARTRWSGSASSSTPSRPRISTRASNSSRAEWGAGRRPPVTLRAGHPSVKVEDTPTAALTRAPAGLTVAGTTLV